MRIARAITTLMAAGLLAVTATGAASTAAAGKPGGCTPGWKLVSAPAPEGPAPSSLITGVAVDSAGDAWFPATNHGGFGPVSWVYHWDGRSFGTTTTIPEGTYTWRSTAYGEPFDGPWVGPVSFDSPTDGWLIGSTSSPYLAGDSQPFAAHWSGHRWTITPLAVSPHPASVFLNAPSVAAISPTDAWAAGYYFNYPHQSTAGALIEHWDGARWSIVPNPASRNARTQLNSITALSATDIWAVGQQQKSSGALVPLAEHWDGKSWSIVPTAAGNPTSFLIAVSADSPNDAWAVGYQVKPGTRNQATGLVEHWDGHTWSVVSGLPGLGNSELLAVYSASSSDVWATIYTPRTNTDLGVNKFLHWDGSTWATVPVPGPHQYNLDYEYTGITGTGPGNIWAAGWINHPSGGADQTPLIAHLTCG